MKDNKVKFMTTTALMAAVICILGPLSIPIGPVPISLTNFAIYITMYVLGTKKGTVAFLVYLLLGLVGLPVFSGFSGGPWKLFGPTGGYLIGFIPMAIVIGLFLKKHYTKRIACIIVMEAATWIAYLLGSVWLAVQSNLSLSAALAAGVLPFILLDLIKIVISSILGPILRTRLAPFTGINEE